MARRRFDLEAEQAKMRERWQDKRGVSCPERVSSHQIGQTPQWIYKLLWEVNEGRCAICEKQVNDLCVDHDHWTGGFRDLLCGRCNKAIGLLLDDATIADRAAAYLRKHGARPTPKRPETDAEWRESCERAREAIERRNSRLDLNHSPS